MFKVNNKDTRTTSGVNIVNFEHIFKFILLSLLLNSYKYSETLVSDSKFVFNNCEKYIVLSAGKILLGYMFYFIMKFTILKVILTLNNHLLDP